jgi:hypothetical protein
MCRVILPAGPSENSEWAGWPLRMGQAGFVSCAGDLCVIGRDGSAGWGGLALLNGPGCLCRVCRVALSDGPVCLC